MCTNEDERDIYLQWLSQIEGLGFQKQHLLLKVFENRPQDIYFASEGQLALVKGLSLANIRAIAAARSETRLKTVWEACRQKGISYVSIYHADYPELLKQIYDPPLGLYVLGTFPRRELTRLAIIGARRCSEYGLTVAKLLSKSVARHLVVVSGMARGIDSMAHRGALEGGGETIAVLGCGVDYCYPSENRPLYQEIMRHGCVVSEFPPGTRPLPGNFPMRNRIISGMSSGVLVVEAADKSGTLITVDQALDQGREVLAVMGNITSKLSHGTNALIAQGAAVPVSDEPDVLYALGLLHNLRENKDNDNNLLDALAPEEKLVYDCITFEPVSVDELVLQLQTGIQEVQYMLTMLELRGAVQRLPGQRYIRSI